MAKNTSITLGEHFESIIEKSIASGRYASASEVIRAGLRKIEEEEQKITALKEAIEAGENSGYITDFDPKEFLERMHAKHSK
ncbi:MULTISPECIES: type II toxin-antitoxin system ParD family antitoxin [Cyclobacterium]|uniref:Addiction module antidote protein, CC2985 family n=2 Tax=Cyclobacterium TaxID=68288 RepID=G0J3K6_CYCMS|nr:MULTISPECIES: type II toxin-antitoxin system ParD family antitoxin [Cyclobacterium]AEL24645.1 addiction module antidote protein, CC2985 family [Cyclobacterium marinum DSM 745]AKP50226.1 Addiction module antidote protein, CC2985 family [Cyclobacterium amurskyense]MBI0399298.1 type II toxin-antitoxin system ParD family antitoxin [Cyclobacterium marinum]MBR9775228.1 type II toxin-antitoxin system ParD family antitoxin [Cytophagales bacterium]|tara:strand:- start:662 stop:907 length:246 start_codon:yes stop_codon:yes gene_type:complete